MRLFIDWLTATPLSDALKTHAWAVPAIQTVHILAIAILMGSVLIVDLRLVGLGSRSQTIGDVARRYLPWFWGAFAVLLVMARPAALNGGSPPSIGMKRALAGSWLPTPNQTPEISFGSNDGAAIVAAGAGWRWA